MVHFYFLWYTFKKKLIEFIMLNKVDGNTVPINPDVRLKIQDWLSKSVAPAPPLNNPFPRGLEFSIRSFNHSDPKNFPSDQKVHDFGDKVPDKTSSVGDLFNLEKITFICGKPGPPPAPIHVLAYRATHGLDEK